MPFRAFDAALQFLRRRAATADANRRHKVWPAPPGGRAAPVESGFILVANFRVADGVDRDERDEDRSRREQKNERGHGVLLSWLLGALLLKRIYSHPTRSATHRLP